MKELNETPRNLRAVWVPMTLTALVMALLIAAAVTASPTQAQGLTPGGPGPGDVDLDVDLNTIEYDAPYPCNGDKPIADDAAETIDNEHYAVFDAFWDYNHNRLSNNFCPPGAEHEEVRVGRKTVVTTTRMASNIDIRKTVLSITDASKKRIVNTTTVTSGQISRVTYSFLSASSTHAWWLQEDDDRYLAMGFSTGLLKAAHWQVPGEGNESLPPVQFEFEAIELPACADANEEAHFYVFETGSGSAKWDSSNTDTNNLKMKPGEYKHFNWAFTCPGIYKIQVHFKAHVKHPSPLGIPVDDKVITSEAQLYTFHIGPEDDLGVKITPESQTVASSATSTSFTVKATNGGPDTSTDAEVQIYLPEGLDYVADSSHTGVTYDNSSGVIVWDLGQLAATVSSTTPTLNFRASIDRTKATGTVRVRAEIRNVAGEDLDPISANDVSFAAVKLGSASTHPPIFAATRYVAEFASSFERVGKPVTAFSPEGRSLTYSLSGRGHEKFKVLGNGQIIVANNVVLEYEKQWSYWLTLNASDGTNSDTILVKIRVVNVPGPKVRMWLQEYRTDETRPPANLMNPSIHHTIDLLGTVHNPPTGKIPSSCVWKIGDIQASESYAEGACLIRLPSDVIGIVTGPVTYSVEIFDNGADDAIAAGSYTINWAP